MGTYLEGHGRFLDPFCGSGTALVEAARSSKFDDVVGYDCNPIALLIADFKTLNLAPLDLENGDRILDELATSAPAFAHSDRALTSFPGRDHWFHAQVQREIAAILDFISSADRSDWELTWLRCALSSIITRVGFQDSDTRYVRSEHAVVAGETSSLFVERTQLLLSALKSRGSLHTPVTTRYCNVMDGFLLDTKSVDLIITSPPYANKMDYYLYHKQRMNVLGMDFKRVQQAEIGSRHEYSSKRRDPQQWSNDLEFILRETRRVLSDDGRAVWIIGDSQIAGERIDLSLVVTDLAEKVKMRCEVIESVPLSERSRSFNAAFRAANQMEHTIQLQR